MLRKYLISFILLFFISVSYAQLNGTYTIGTTGDYSSIQSAISDLESQGINDTVVMKIQTGTYNNQYRIHEISGTSDTSFVEFTSETGNADDVILTCDSLDYLLYLAGADNIHFSNLSFVSDSAINFVVIDSIANRNIFSYNNFTSQTCSKFIFNTSWTDSLNVFSYNNFDGSDYAIYLDGSRLTEIQNNTFNNVNNNALYSYSGDSFKIIGNTINSGGIYFSHISSIIFKGNRFNSEFKEFQLTDCDDFLFADNFISGESNGSVGKIYIESCNNFRFVYNSIKCMAEHLILKFSTSDVLLKNNTIVNDNPNGIVISFDQTTYDSDYNNFYSSGSNFINDASNTYSSLSDWQAATSSDLNSINVLPVFVSETDFHTNTFLLDNAGTPISSIDTIDIDGNIRNSTTPDIGAVEFSSTCTGVLSGIKTIGSGGSGEYEDFNSAITALYECGVSDALTFVVKPGIYNQQVTIDGSLINYTNGIKPIEFICQTIYPEDVVLKYNADTLNNYTLKIKDIHQLTINGITIEALDTNYGRVISLEGIVDSTTILNNIINGVNTINQTTCISLKELNQDSLMNITFLHNLINNGKDGISIVDNQSYVKLSVNIKDNSFINQKRNAILLFNKTASIVSNNISSDFAKYGIIVYNLDSFNISKNIIKLKSETSTGIKASGSVFISNNFISIINGDYGIWSTGDSKIINNSILLTNTESSSSCIENNSLSSISKIYNNNLINNGTGHIIYNYINNYSNWDIDYNNLYSSSSNFDYNYLINIIGGNTHSVSFMPNFVSNNNLHTNSALLYKTGVTIPEVTTDIDSETRNNPPCIGADEFTNPELNIGTDTIVCYYDDNYDINNYIIDIGFGWDSYQWSTGSDSSSTGLNSYINIVSPYSITVTKGTETYSDTITVGKLKPTAINPKDICISEGDTISVCASNYTTNYEWFNGDTTQCFDLNVYDYLSLITLKYEETNYGCKNIDTLDIHPTFEPANFNLSIDTTICYDEVMHITANNYNQTDVYNKYSFLWNTGDTTQIITVDSLNFSVGIHEISVIVTNLEEDLMCESYDTVFVELKNCSSVNNIENTNRINLYPNPAENFIQIEIDDLNNDVMLKIRDITGNLVKQLTYNNNSIIDIHNLEKGIYFIEITFDNDTFITKQFIVK